MIELNKVDILQDGAAAKDALVKEWETGKPINTTPPLSPEANGFWWIRLHNKWWVAGVAYSPIGEYGEQLLVWLHDRGVCAKSIPFTHPDDLTWGGRITPPQEPGKEGKP